MSVSLPLHFCTGSLMTPSLLPSSKLIVSCIYFQCSFIHIHKTYRHFSKDIQTAKKHMKKCSTSLIIRGMQINTIGITSRKSDGETVERVADFIFGASKITIDGDCSHEIKKHLLLGRKVMTNLDSILKSRDITLSTKIHLVKALVFPVVMYGCESWSIKKAECQRNDTIELWCWSLESPLDCKETQPVYPKGDQSWVFIGRTDVEAETPILWPPDVKN